MAGIPRNRDVVRARSPSVCAVTVPPADRRSRRAARSLVAAVAVALTASCTIGTPTDATTGLGLEPARSLSADGLPLAADVDWATRPRSHVRADLDPATGSVSARWSATLPIDASDEEVELLFPPLLAGFADDDVVEDVTVDGVAIDADLSRTAGTITIPLPTPGRTTVDVGLRFSYVVNELALGEGGPVGPVPAGDVGRSLLARNEGGLALGPWLPVYDFAAGADGVRRTGSVAAAQISAELSVPSGYDVVTSGVRTRTQVEGGRVVVLEQAVGARDLTVVVGHDLTTVTGQSGATDVRVHVPSADRADADAVLENALRSLGALEAAFGPYPWRELDLVAVPMRSEFGGLGWSGAVWLESTLVSTDDGWTAADRRWAVAHELAHQWWGGQVRSDARFEPAQDEMVAQYAACRVHHTLWPAAAEEACEQQIDDVYLAMRASGLPDSVVNKGYFSSTEQQQGLVYGKAPQALLQLGEDYGDQAVLDGLGAFVRTHAFGFADEGALATHLGIALDDPVDVAQTWDRWLNELNADEDLGYSGG